MFDRTVTSYIVLVDIAIFIRKRSIRKRSIRKRSKHNIKSVYYNIVLKETGAPRGGVETPIFRGGGGSWSSSVMPWSSCKSKTKRSIPAGNSFPLPTTLYLLIYNYIRS